MKKQIFKNLIIACIIALSPKISGAQAHNYEQDYESARTTVIKVAKDFSLSWAKTKWFFNGMDHTNWYVKYENGMVVWNNFRSYRTSVDVLNYYTGKTSGDCDAWYNNKGKRYNLCYDSKDHIKRYRKSFGQIVDMGFTNNKGNTNSLFLLTHTENKPTAKPVATHTEKKVVPPAKPQINADRTIVPVTSSQAVPVH